MPKKVTILIADDHSVVRGGVKALLETQSHYKVIAEAQTGQEAIEKAKVFRPDVAILDIRMPGVSGIEACRQITESGWGCNVIMLSAYAEDELLFASIQAGASGYVLKLVGNNELLHAVERISNGEGYIDPAMTKSILKVIHSATETQDAAQFANLTSREIEVLTLLSKGLTNKQIGGQLYLAEGTIRNCVSDVLSKLDVANRAEAAAFAIKYRLGDLVVSRV